MTAERRLTSIVAYAECRAAIAGAHRARRLETAEARKAVKALDEIWPSIGRIAASEAIVRRAGALTERRALRGFDAIHLASALATGSNAEFACWDDALSEAAKAEGLRLAR